MLTQLLGDFFLRLKDLFVNFSPVADTLDILLVAFIIYGIIVNLRKTQSIQILKGILVIIVVYGIVTAVGMQTSSFVFTRFFTDIIVIFVVIFSAEIRQALESMGKNSLGRRLGIFGSGGDEAATNDAINSVCRAAGAMSRNSIGSLIIFQRNSLLGDLTKQAVRIDSETTYEMICSIFFPKAPLHDGAVVIKDGRIVAARCVVPMKNNREVNEGVGTRHRAAIEISMNTDAVAVVTSEETGIISIAVEGQLIRNLTPDELREKLGYLLIGSGDRKKEREKKKSEKKTASSEDKTSENEAAAEQSAVSEEADTKTEKSGLENEGGEDCEQE